MCVMKMHCGREVQKKDDFTTGRFLSKNTYTCISYTLISIVYYIIVTYY